MSVGAMTEEKFYTVKEIAELLRTSRRTIWNMINNGELDAISVRNEYRISESALEDFLEKSRKHKEKEDN